MKSSSSTETSEIYQEYKKPDTPKKTKKTPATPSRLPKPVKTSEKKKKDQPGADPDSKASGQTYQKPTKNRHR